ncbi:MAG: hypothetical protein K0S32_2851 [Bacteroidetes bacterium]|jgi:hypothetical protein|nr:hypothetical protein [Bacteroidota bacterium]
MSIFPNIEGLDEIPMLHFRYAEYVLKKLIENILEQDEIDIGVEGEKTAIVSFYGDTDNLQLSILYVDHSFKIRVVEHGDSTNTAKFIYNLTENELEEDIPGVLREEMQNVAFEREPAVVKVNHLKIEKTEEE